MVWGRVSCTAEYAEPSVSRAASAVAAACSAGVRSSAVAGSGATSGGMSTRARTASGCRAPIAADTLVPQSLPAATKRSYPNAAISSTQTSATRSTPQPRSVGLPLNP